MAMAMLARALSLRRANERAKQVNTRLQLGDAAVGRQSNAEASLEDLNDYSIHSARVSQSIDALYVLSCLREGLSLVDTLTSDDVDCASTSCEARLSVEGKKPRSSVSLNSEVGAGTVSESAWDGFSSSMCSSRRDSTDHDLSVVSIREGMPMPRPSKGRRSNAENSTEFCLALTNEQIDCPDSSASPRSGVISDCCSFLLGRKSSHGEDDIRAIRSKDQPSLNAVNGISASCPQREERSKQRSNHSSAATKSAKPDNSLTCDWQLRQVAEETKTDGDVQRLLKEDAIEATEKQSSNPYLDLRESMLEMMLMITSSYSTTRGYCSEQDDGDVLSSLAAIPGKGMISIEDLLYCYLRLNSIDLYELIATAFFDTFSDFVTIHRD